MTNEQINKAIYFSINQPPQKLSDLSAPYSYLDKKINFIELLAELNGLDMLNHFEERFSLKHTVKQQIDNLPRDFENKPYEYFLSLQRKKTEDEIYKKWYDSENARLQFEDYPKTNKMAKIALGISIALLILELIKLVIHRS